MKRVAILGGGLSGLAAAWQLAQDRAAEFVIFEASHRLGGIVETKRIETADGYYIIECGPDAWVTEKPQARELAIELGLETEIISSNDHQRKTYLLKNNSLIPMPEGMRMMVPTQWEPIMQSPLFSEETRQAYRNEVSNAEALKQSALKEGEDESVASFVRRHFGAEVVHTLAGPLLSGIFGGNVEKLSARAVMPAFVKMEREHGSLITALQQKQTATTQPIFTTIKSGLGTLVDRMQAVLPANTVRFACPAHALRQNGSQWQVQTGDATETFDAVIIATPAHITREFLRPLNEQVATLLTMEATSAIVVAIGFSLEQSKQLQIPQGFGYLVPQTGNTGDPQLLACTFMNQKFPHRAPEGAVLLRAFFGGETAATLLHVDDAHLVSLAHKNLSATLGPLPDPILTIVRRLPKSLPQYEVGHLDRMRHLEKIVATLPGLQLIGNAYHGVGLPDMVRQGREAAQKFY
jgi:protoporphyrinogen/coproporphyrinogen III oxidase